MGQLWFAFKSARPAQWIKNIVVFAPIVFSGFLFVPGSLTRVIWAFGLFCALSSSVYILNDLIDIESDREHPFKKKRLRESIETYVNYNWDFSKGSNKIIKEKARTRKPYTVRLMSILKENLDRVKQELETFGIESKIRKAVNGQGRIYYELSSYGRENLDKWLSNDLISEEQIKKMYNDEKHLFATNAKATIYGSSTNPMAIAYDDDTELLHVGTSAGRSVFQGLRRVDNTTDAVGAAISASNGMIAED